ncbi:putative catalyzes the hydroxylation of L-kynurenine (L-Kyn) to form 3-hydroxy-L-kynurenine (L-3OHKyn) [Lyophyllum shimeji]|uniref:Kynurenine 3-monooxygenase n=1 Tax=Lyophyllum shimeji TaxID=47721 RepID=A0A9P3PFK7_LYOSH|nr:putative catalyzes the hydroxylation of L-kynurenine (L-Kyn) to form 3-hydroxy-L-kynurenine (L-3OHKyn) [Lyophyllum shimeji]
MSSLPRKVVVVGAGPVGCLAAMAFAKQGWRVDVYEGRPDLRLPSSKAVSQHRSINLAMSHRGIAALEAVDSALTHRFMQAVIPMRGRMIHSLKGDLDSQLYDKNGQCINSIDRALLNEELLEEASRSENIRIFFKRKVVAADFDRKIITLRNLDSGEELSVDFDFCIGADGSYSVIRRQMMRVVRMDYQQEYIKHEYIELKMPAGRDSYGKPKFLLDPNHLHIWPRHSFMLIALPNKDKTFTCTLFAPSSDLDRLNSADTIIAWFRTYFPDALSMIGEETLVKDFMRNPRSPLICTKSNPYHYKDRAIILGDAAHSMVPFYGQGLNCGLEDVRILMTLLLQEGVKPTAPSSKESTSDESLLHALDRYSESRHEDLLAICDMAMDNYVEMRHAVTTPGYLFRKTLDNILYSLSHGSYVPLSSLGPLLSRVPYPPGNPSGWLPLYTMVTFRPDISYATAKKRAARQARILEGLGWTLMTLIGVAATWIIWMALAPRIQVRR